MRRQRHLFLHAVFGPLWALVFHFAFVATLPDESAEKYPPLSWQLLIWTLSSLAASQYLLRPAILPRRYTLRLCVFCIILVSFGFCGNAVASLLFGPGSFSSVPAPIQLLMSVLAAPLILLLPTGFHVPALWLLGASQYFIGTFVLRKEDPK